MMFEFLLSILHSLVRKNIPKQQCLFAEDNVCEYSHISSKCSQCNNSRHCEEIRHECYLCGACHPRNDQCICRICSRAHHFKVHCSTIGMCRNCKDWHQRGRKCLIEYRCKKCGGNHQRDGRCKEMRAAGTQLPPLDDEFCIDRLQGNFPNESVTIDQIATTLNVVIDPIVVDGYLGDFDCF